MLALVDFTLWIAHSGPHEIRRTCFDRIAQELGSDRRLKGSSYDGLLVAAWLFDDWAARIEWLAHKLTSRSSSQLLVAYPRLAPAAQRAIASLLWRAGATHNLQPCTAFSNTTVSGVVPAGAVPAAAP